MDFGFLLPLIVGIITQGIKFLISFIKGDFSIHSLLGYGGMPSGHGATVTSLCIYIGMRYGMESSAFAVAFILAIFIIWDAIGLRNIVSKHGVLLEELSENKARHSNKFLFNKKQIGHTIPEVLAGIVTGVILTLLLQSITRY